MFSGLEFRCPNHPLYFRPFLYYFLYFIFIFWIPSFKNLIFFIYLSPFFSFHSSFILFNHIFVMLQTGAVKQIMIINLNWILLVINKIYTLFSESNNISYEIFSHWNSRSHNLLLITLGSQSFFKIENNLMWPILKVFLAWLLASKLKVGYRWKVIYILYNAEFSQ